MKKLSLVVVAAVVVCCTKTQEVSLPGAYRMLSQTFKGDTIDVTFTNPQLKIFTQEYMMYGSYVPKDSISSFGIGKYSLKDGMVDEISEYRAGDTTASSETTTYHLAVEKTGKGYRQIIRDMEIEGQKYTLTEEYEAVGNGTVSPLDGAWVMTSGYNISGADTSELVGTQYKAYSAGNFMFAHSYRDSLNVQRTGLGYGTFVMNGENGASETIQTSSYPQIVGRPFQLQITFTGPDEFMQVITDGNGSSTENYRRLGK